MGFIDIFNYKKYFKVKSDATVARVGHVNAVYKALQTGLVGPQGPKGDTGPAGPVGPTAPSGLNWMGAYDAETTYNTNDVATYTNPESLLLGSYWATEDGVIDVTPVDGEGFINPGWAFLASQGPRGLDGITSINGMTGAINAFAASNTYTTNTLGLAIAPLGGTNLNFSLNQPYKSVVGTLTFSGTTFTFTPIVNEWGTISATGTTLAGPNGYAQCELTFATDFDRNPVAIQITAAETNNATKKWYSSTNNSLNKIQLNVAQGAASAAGTTITAPNLVGLKAFVEIRFYNA